MPEPHDTCARCGHRFDEHLNWPLNTSCTASVPDPDGARGYSLCGCTLFTLASVETEDGGTVVDAPGNAAPAEPTVPPQPNPFSGHTREIDGVEYVPVAVARQAIAQSHSDLEQTMLDRLAAMEQTVHAIRRGAELFLHLGPDAVAVLQHVRRTGTESTGDDTPGQSLSAAVDAGTDAPDRATPPVPASTLEEDSLTAAAFTVTIDGPDNRPQRVPVVRLTDARRILDQEIAGTALAFVADAADPPRGEG